MAVRMCEEKQAIYINQLSYRLFKLNRGNDLSEVITISQARDFTYQMAEDIIKNLRMQINNAEDHKFDLGILEKIKVEMRKYYKVQLVENYKIITRVKVDLKQKKAWLTTDAGEVIDIDGSIRTDEWENNYEALFSEVKTAIDSDKRLNIYKTNNRTMVYLEPEEGTKEFNRKLEGFINRIMNITDGKLPVEKGEVQPDAMVRQPDKIVFDKVLNYVFLKDLKLYEELSEFMENKSNTQILSNVLKQAYYKENGFVIDTDKVELP